LVSTVLPITYCEIAYWLPSTPVGVLICDLFLAGQAIADRGATAAPSRRRSRSLAKLFQ
jgi:hypothetical protein